MTKMGGEKKSNSMKNLLHRKHILHLDLSNYRIMQRLEMF